jgi:hypothetical protein
MKRNLLSFLPAVATYAALSAYLLVPAEVAAQSPPQGPPPASSRAQAIPVFSLNDSMFNIVKPVVAAEDAALVNDPNFHATITADVYYSNPVLAPTTNLDQPNQLFASVPYTILYTVSNISVKVNGSWVPYDQTATIGQDLKLQASCEGWFTGRGALTYNVTVVSPAILLQNPQLPNIQLVVFLEQVLPNFVNSQVTPQFASFGTSSSVPVLASGDACSSLGVSASGPDQYPLIFFDLPAKTSPITGQDNPVTVKVTRIHRLELDGADGLPAYSAVETPTLDFFAGFTHLRFELPSMTEGQTFIPTSDNEASTQVPLESGTLVLLGVMTYKDIPNKDNAFLTFSRNLDYGAGKQTLYTPKVLLKGVASSGGPAYEITLEITAPPVSIGAQ